MIKIKLGIISDIHGNIDALNAVIKELDNRNVEKIIVLGDVIGIGPYPDECVKRLIEIKDKLIPVKGNHEGYFLDSIPDTIHGGRELAKAERDCHKWIHSKISNEAADFLKTFPEEQLLEIDGKKIFISHYPDNSKFCKYPEYENCVELFENINSDVCLFGHTHIKVAFIEGEKKFINPGSVGCPINDNCAPAGILNVENGKVNYEDLQIDYDIEKVISDIKKIDYPDCENMIKWFYKREE